MSHLKRARFEIDLSSRDERQNREALRGVTRFDGLRFSLAFVRDAFCDGIADTLLGAQGYSSARISNGCGVSVVALEVFEVDGRIGAAATTTEGAFKDRSAVSICRAGEVVVLRLNRVDATREQHEPDCSNGANG